MEQHMGLCVERRLLFQYQSSLLYIRPEIPWKADSSSSSFGVELCNQPHSGRVKAIRNNSWEHIKPHVTIKNSQRVRVSTFGLSVDSYSIG
ncbi:hypothetical protein Gasu2_49770 [Galdieria sulphuraria]|nr:hypothetical protein Gasu2_49770 [Galdieria sulphuraria]